MTRVAIVSSEPIRPRMGGIGIRYVELARHLPASGVDTVLFSPSSVEEATVSGLPRERLRVADPSRFARELATFDAVVVQGQLANDVVASGPAVPTVIDLYDPWLIENLHYRESLGLDPYRNDHASWVLQLTRGDFFLCASSEQRLFVLGFLAALGRVNPESIAEEPELRHLVAVVPFGVEEPPAHRPLLAPREAGERRLLFGGIYDWYDPETAVEALDELRDPGARLLFVRHPHPETTPQRRFGDLERFARQKGLWPARVEAIDWVPAERRFDLLRDVDVLVATHRPGLETDLSMRTRFLDALAVRCPVATSEGGAIARLLVERRAGWVVPPRDPPALAAALRQILGDPSDRAARTNAGAALARELAWPRVIAPLAEFLKAPRFDPAKEKFSFHPPTTAPADSLAFRARRFLSRRGAAR